MDFLKLGASIKVVRAFAFAFAMSASTACSSPPNPIPVGTATPRYGNLRAGSHFDVSIGESLARARSRLVNENYKPLGEVGCDYNLKTLVRCTPNERAEAFGIDQTFHHGVVYLEHDGQRVTGIVWSFRMLPAVDL